MQGWLVQMQNLWRPRTGANNNKGEKAAEEYGRDPLLGPILCSYVVCTVDSIRTRTTTIMKGTIISTTGKVFRHFSVCEQGKS